MYDNKLINDLRFPTCSLYVCDNIHMGGYTCNCTNSISNFLHHFGLNYRYFYNTIFLLLNYIESDNYVR